MSAIAIRLIGGVLGGAIGTYVSGKMYDYIYTKKPEPINQEKVIEPPKSFEEILYNSVKAMEEKPPEHNDINPSVYPYETNYHKKIFVNDAIYDNNFHDDYHEMISSISEIYK